MSHQATNWAIQQRGLKPASKIVLWHLCDRFHADHGCFPEQETLAYDTEMSRSALNEHLKILEERRLIRRVQRVDEKTGKQRSTLYLFAFQPEFSETQDVGGPRPESGHGAVSGKTPSPSPDFGDSRVRIPDTNSVREPVKEPGGARERAEGEKDFDILWESWPAAYRPDNRQAALRIFLRLASIDRLKAIGGAETYCTAMARRKKPRRMITYLKEGLFLDFHDKPELDAEGRFILKPGMPEWGRWLGTIRIRYGERSVETIVKCGFYKVLDRNPPPVDKAA